ncbi:hypothetical protein BJY01DRAFT_220566 [Aspergillus pseudoustus]|uniref:Uncharacterized protein n=1 Tax=Aspergillus pseudoustus TaxID=1810923 RepID=A0ABR4JCJ4_9EURO
MANFRLVEHLSHLVVQPSDVRLNPPEGYLFVQDGLIISCGVLYALMYAFAMILVVRDRFLPGSVKYLSLTLAYEFYYAFTTTSTLTERACFLIWFALDLAFVGLALWQVYSPAQRHRIVTEMAMLYFPLALGALKCLSTLYPDERQQVTAYWTGIFLQLPVGWVYVYRLLADRSTRGQSLEVWLVRYLGCFTAYGVFIWRYLNVPRNWGYVGSFWSIGVIVATLVPETVYPFVYIWVWKGSERRKVKVG